MIDVRSMTAADVPAVAALQSRFLEGSIVTDLGPRFLQAFHRAALAAPTTSAFAAVGAAGIVGFALGAANVDAFYRHVKPRIVLPLARALAWPSGLPLAFSVARSLVEPKPRPPVPAELLLLVVDPGARRQGIGRRLLASLEAAFRWAGAPRYRVAVRSHLEAARAFYLATGFEFEQELEVLGRPMTYLLKRLGP